MAEAIVTLDALAQMGRRAGLRARVEERLTRILEAAIEIRQLPGGQVDRSAPLILRVDEYEVSYSIDLENEAIHIFSVEPFRDGRPQSPGRVGALGIEPR